MDEQVKSVSWEAYEHAHTEKGSDWFWALGIITIAVTVAAILLGNVLFGILIFVAGCVTALHANREPQIIEHAVTSRGVQVGEKMYPYSTLDVFYIDEEDPLGPQLLIRSQKLFMPLIIMPLPEEYVDDIEELVASRIPEEFLEEPFANKLLEFFGF
tara:strand:+ start:1539 stop:2009 length:471 start_codon:yes stop_codon:yes gene_type:complete